VHLASWVRPGPGSERVCGREGRDGPR